VNLDIKRVVANRHWCNKLWNAIRFALLNLGTDFKPTPGFGKEGGQLPMACRWSPGMQESICLQGWWCGGGGGQLCLSGSTFDHQLRVSCDAGGSSARLPPP